MRQVVLITWLETQLVTGSMDEHFACFVKTILAKLALGKLARLESRLEFVHMFPLYSHWDSWITARLLCHGLALNLPVVSACLPH